MAPSQRIYALGVILLVALTNCSHRFNDRGGLSFMISLTVAGFAYLFATREFISAPRFSRRVLIFGLVLAAIWQIEFLRQSPGADDDIHRYVWDGRLQRLGRSPYFVVPSDPAVQYLHTPETRNLNNPSLPSPYPAGAQLFFRLVTAVHESTLALKVAFVICDWAIVFVLLDLLRCNRRGPHLALVYAWNPLLAIEVAGSGHIDVVGALLVVISAAALVRRWRATAAVSLGLAIAVKFLPIVLLPLYWRRIRFRDFVLAAVVIIILYLPFLHLGRIPLGSLGTYIQGFRFNGPVFAALCHLAPAKLIAGLAVIVGLLTAIWFRRASHDVSPTAFAWPMAASLLFAPAVFPWYLIWLLPFLFTSSTTPIIVWTVSIIPTYIMWHLRSVQGVWGSLPRWVMAVEYGSVSLAVAILMVHHHDRLRIPASSEATAADSNTTV